MILMMNMWDYILYLSLTQVSPEKKNFSSWVYEFFFFGSGSDLSDDDDEDTEEEEEEETLPPQPDRKRRRLNSSRNQKNRKNCRKNRAEKSYSQPSEIDSLMAISDDDDEEEGTPEPEGPAAELLRSFFF